MRNILLTGGNTGIGLHTVRQLLASDVPTKVYFTHRSALKPEVVASFKPANTASMAVPIHLDLLSASSIKACAKVITDQNVALDALVLNAAMYTSLENEPATIGEERINEVIVANVIGSAALLRLLKEPLEQGDGKVVWLGSQLYARVKHDVTASNLEDLTTLGDPSDPPVYGVSKLVALHYTRAVSDINVVTVSPGFIPTTSLSRGSPWYARWAMYYLISMMPMAVTAEEGARRVVSALEGDYESGTYLSKCEPTPLKEECNNTSKNKQWYQWVEKKVDEYLEVA